MRKVCYSGSPQIRTKPGKGISRCVVLTGLLGLIVISGLLIVDYPLTDLLESKRLSSYN